MYESTMQILQQHKIKIEHIEGMRTYGLIVDPNDIAAPKNLNNSFGMGLYVKHRGYIQLGTYDCTRKELINLFQDIEELTERNDDGN